MKLYRPDPCPECPFRKASPAGWLGGHSAISYADLLRIQAPTACHLTVREDGQGQPSLCTGAAQVLANAGSLPRDPEHGQEVTKAGRNPEVFASWVDFLAHHHRQEEVSPGCWLPARQGDTPPETE